MKALAERSPDAVATAKRLRRFDRLKRQLIADRGNDPTAAQLTLAHNAAGLAIWCEEQVAALGNGDDVNITVLGTTMNTLRRLLETLGIERVPRDVTTIEQYLDRHKQAINGETVAQ